MLHENHWGSSVENASEGAPWEKQEENYGARNLQNVSDGHDIRKTRQSDFAASSTWLTRRKYFKCCWNIVITILCEITVK